MQDGSGFAIEVQAEQGSECECGLFAEQAIIRAGAPEPKLPTLKEVGPEVPDSLFEHTEDASTRILIRLGPRTRKEERARRRDFGGFRKDVVITEEHKERRTRGEVGSRAARQESDSPR